MRGSIAAQRAARENLELAQIANGRARVLQHERRRRFVIFVLRLNALGYNDREIGDMISRKHSNINSLVQVEMKRQEVKTRLQLFVKYIREGLVTGEMFKAMPSQSEIKYFTDVSFRATLDDDAYVS